MNRRPSPLRRWVSLTALAAAVTSLGARGARADKPAPTASASSAPELARRDLTERPPPATVSAHPTPDEWKAAEPVAFARSTEACRAVLLREWIRVQCRVFNPMSVALLTGDGKDVHFFIGLEPSPHGMAMTVQEGFIVVEMPLRRGEHRLLQAARGDIQDYGGVGPQVPTWMLSVRWLDGDPGPVLSLIPITR